MRTDNTQSQSQTGFALLMALIVVGVVFSIGLTLLDLSIKQVKLSTMAKDSEIAFHAANAGMECARYTRRKFSDEMEDGSSITPACFGVTVGANSRDADYEIFTGGVIHRYEYDFTWGPADARRCTKTTVLVATTAFDAADTITLTGMPTVIPGYPSENFSCDPGGRCTVISVQGYNKSCTDTTLAGTIQREVVAEF
jgi:hypothetical protein